MEIISNAQLTEEDIKELKYNCRAGIAVPVLMFLIGSSLTVFIEFFNLANTVMFITKFQVIMLSEVFILIICSLTSYLMLRKLVTDIRNGEKIVEKRIVSQKDEMEDYEAGSATLYIGQEMNPFEKYSIVVEGSLYRVDKELYNAVEIGDNVYFHYAPVSKYRIKITAKKTDY
ncbi:MAG: hypothetical protein NTZ33_08015 [Bacteroidetes bacterium]|nr:hypothetical protein [Bacteroidota bacterium]